MMVKVPAEGETTCAGTDIEHLLNIDKNGVIVAVMGLTGVGKSHFISRLGGHRFKIASTATVGHTLDSQTKEIDVFATVYRGKTFYLVDTPGFDDTTTSNAEILQLIADFLAWAYKVETHVDGVVYLHRITDNRVAGHAASNIDLFEKLCGNQGMKIVTFLTTMWDAAGNVPGFTRKDFEKHEEELIGKHWSRMIKAGAQVRRSLNTVESLQAVLDGILTTKARQGPRRPVLHLAEELVDECLSLGKTDAGKVLVEEFEQSITKLEEQKQFLELALNDDPDNASARLKFMEVSKELIVFRDGAKKFGDWSCYIGT